MDNKQRDKQVAAVKMPPHSIEAEQSVLGGLMLDNDAWDKVSEKVVEQDFYLRSHRFIFPPCRAWQKPTSRST